MTVAFLEEGNDLYCSAGISGRYLNNIAYSFAQTGVRTIFYTDTILEDKMSRGVLYRHFTRINTADYDILIVSRTPEMLEWDFRHQDFKYQLDTNKPIYYAACWINAQKHDAFTGYMGLGTDDTSIPFWYIPWVIPSPTINIPFSERKRRIAYFTPSEVFFRDYLQFFEAIRHLRLEYPHLAVVGRCLISDLIYPGEAFVPINELPQRAYQICQAYSHLKNSYLLFWNDWLENLFTLQTTGIMVRTSWLDIKLSTIEALAYGNFVILIGTHQYPFYDYNDVIVIQNNPGLIISTIRGILEKPDSEDYSHYLSAKYQAKYSLENAVTNIRLFLDR